MIEIKNRIVAVRCISCNISSHVHVTSKFRREIVTSVDLESRRRSKIMESYYLKVFELLSRNGVHVFPIVPN